MGTPGASLARSLLGPAKMLYGALTGNTRPRRQRVKITYQYPTSSADLAGARPAHLTTAGQRHWQPTGSDPIASGTPERAAGNYFPEPGLAEPPVLRRQSAVFSPATAWRKPDTPAWKVKGLHSEDTVYPDSVGMLPLCPRSFCRSQWRR